MTIPVLAQAPDTNEDTQSPYLIAQSLSYVRELPQIKKETQKTQEQEAWIAYLGATYTLGALNLPLAGFSQSKAYNVALGEKLSLNKVIWPCLYELGMRESGWSNTVENKTSGAFGIPQALPASKLDSYGDRNDPEVQIRWMIDYVIQRYGGSCEALEWQIKNNWY